MEPILHLSLPVRDLVGSIEFYVDVLGCGLGRVQNGDADIWFFGMQVTLHERPDEVLAPEQRGVRHFGVTVGADDLQALLARAETHGVDFLSNVTTDYAGTPRE